LKTQKSIGGSRKEKIMNQQAIEVVEPAFVKNTGIYFNYMGVVKAINFLFSTLADKIICRNGWTNIKGFPPDKF
jgi:hypothetical protein